MRVRDLAAALRVASVQDKKVLIVLDDRRKVVFDIAGVHELPSMVTITLGEALVGPALRDTSKRRISDDYACRAPRKR